MRMWVLPPPKEVWRLRMRSPLGVVRQAVADLEQNVP